MMRPTMEQLKEASHIGFHVYRDFTAFCNLTRTCEECDIIVRFGCMVKRKIEKLQTKRILFICKSMPPKEEH